MKCRKTGLHPESWAVAQAADLDESQSLGPIFLKRVQSLGRSAVLSAAQA